VRCKVLQVPFAGSSLSRVAHDLEQRKQTLKEDRHVFSTREGLMEVGGEAQLEALAFFSQLIATRQVFGYELAHLAQQDLMDEQWQNLRYRWADVLLHYLGLGASVTVSEGISGLNIGFLCAVLYASLMQRAWGQEKPMLEGGAAGLPANRLPGFLNVLRPRFHELGSMNVMDAWEVVDATAKELYGRTILEEMRTDYARQEAWCEEIASMEPVPDEIKRALSDYHRLRGKLIDTFEEDPDTFVDPDRFGKDLLFKIHPLPVYTASGGIVGEPAEGLNRLFGYQEPDVDIAEAKWWWAAISRDWPSEDPTTLTLQDRQAWIAVLDFFAPLAKLMMNGRRHRTILGPELVSIEARLEANYGIKLRFDPTFEYPEESSDIQSFYWLTEKSEARCDFRGVYPESCEGTIQQPEGHLVSPWAIRRNVPLAYAIMEALGGGLMGELQFRKDWSVWVACESCYSKLSSAIEDDQGE
jgi:hypothetical protein